MRKNRKKIKPHLFDFESLVNFMVKKMCTKNKKLMDSSTEEPQ